MTAKVIPLREAPVPDEELVSACAQGDAPALRELFRRHHGPVSRFLSKILGTGSAAIDDAVQLTFVVAWRRSDSYGGRASVRSWLFGIAANVARDQRRSDRRRESVFERFSVFPKSEPPLVDEVLSHRQLVQRVMTALDELPHNLRVAYVLCELEDIPGVEAARSVGVRPGTMWKRLHLARKSLRKTLEKDLQ